MNKIVEEAEEKKMKRKNATKNWLGLILGLATSLVLQAIVVACSKPGQRQQVLDSSIEKNVVAIAELGDITSDNSRAYFVDISKVKSAKSETAKAGTIQAAKITLENQTDVSVKSLTETDSNGAVQKGRTQVIERIEDQEKQKGVKSHLAEGGVVSFAVFPHEIRIYKVVFVNEAEQTLATLAKSSDSLSENASEYNNNSTSASFESALTIGQIKAQKNGTSVPSNVAAASSKMSTQDASARFIEIGQVAVSSFGVLDNKRTPHYNEKTSILIVDSRPQELSTHVVLAEPKKDEKPSADPK